METLPADLYGRDRTDRFIRNLTAFTDAYRTLMERSARGKPAPPPRAPAEPSWRTMVVASREQECADVVSLRLAAPGGALLPRWQPGAHLRVRLPSGLVRHYSLCGDIADRAAYTIAVRRIEGGGGGSVELHDDVREGTEVRILGPRNGFPFAADRVVLFIAGGIGITPLLPMAIQAAARNLAGASSTAAAARTRCRSPPGSPRSTRHVPSCTPTTWAAFPIART